MNQWNIWKMLYEANILRFSLDILLLLDILWYLCRLLVKIIATEYSRKTFLGSYRYECVIDITHSMS